MSKGISRLLKERNSGTFPLQITSMIDMFTIILVFLLKSYASSAVDITPSKNMALPASTSQEAPIETLKLMVTKDAVFVDDKQIMVFDTRTIAAQKDMAFKPLFDALTMQAQKSQKIAEKNKSITFDGKIIMLADKTLSYALLKKVMYTAALAGYSDFKFAVITQ